MKKINYQVIDQMHAAQLAANESEATLKALRPQVEEAVQALLEANGLPKDYTGTVEFHGYKIRIQRPKYYTWEQNTRTEVTSDPRYKLHLQARELVQKTDLLLKAARASVKQTAEMLEKKHPQSASIKYGYNIAFLL